jgi:hypothetical protein
MSTNAIIGYELPDNGYAGAYCHYDGYPDVIVPALLSMGHDGVMMAVEKALLEGGFRFFDKTEFETFVECHGEQEATTRSQVVIDEWPCTSECESYNYIIRLNGAVECFNFRGEKLDITPYVKKFQESA